MNERWRDIAIGAGAVLLGHILVLVTVRLIEGSDPAIRLAFLAAVGLALIQLLYVVPLVVYGVLRRKRVAVGAGTMAALTVAFSVVGLLH